MAGDICNLPLFFIKKQTCKGIPYILHATVKRIKSLVDDKYKAKLKNYELYGTGHTAQRAAEATGLQVTGFLAGPLGGVSR